MIQRLGHAPERKPRLLVSFWYNQAAKAEAFAESLGGTWPFLVSHNIVLFDEVERRKRIAVLAYRRGAQVSMLEGLNVVCKGQYWFDKPPRQRGAPKGEQREVDTHRLRLALGTQASIEAHPSSRSVTTTSITTDDPRAALHAMRRAAEAQGIGCMFSNWVEEEEPLRWAIERLIAEGRALRG